MNKDWHGELLLEDVQAEVIVMVTSDPRTGLISWSGSGIANGPVEMKLYKTKIGDLYISRLRLTGMPVYFEFTGTGPINL